MNPHRRQSGLLFSICTMPLIALIIYSSPLPAGPVTDDEKKIYIDEQMRFADGLMDRGHYPLAIAEYQRLIRQFANDPLVADAWMQLAEANATTGNISNAISIYRQFFQKFPEIRTRQAAELNFSRILLDSENAEEHREAIALLSKLRVNKTAPLVIQEAASFYLARHQLKNGRINQAKAMFNELAGKPFSSPDQDRFRIHARLELAKIYFTQDNPDQAIAELEKITQINQLPEQLRLHALQLLATELYNLKKFHRSAESYGQLALLAGNTELGNDATVRRVESLFQAGEYARLSREAKILLKREELQPHLRERILFIQAAALQEQGFHRSAADAYAELVVVSNNPEQVQKAAYQHIDSLIRDKAQDDAKAAVKSYFKHKKIADSTLADLIQMLAESITDKKAILPLLDDAVAALEDKQEKARIQLIYANTLFQEGEFDQARQNYLIAAQNGSQEVRNIAKLQQGECLLRMDQPQAATQWYQDLLKTPLTPEMKAEILLRQAIISLQTSETWDSAKEKLQSLISLKPDKTIETQAKFYLAYIAFYRGDYGQAEKILNPIIEMAEIPTGLKLDAAIYRAWIDLENSAPEKAIAQLQELQKNPEFRNQAPLELRLRFAEAILRTNPEASIQIIDELADAANEQIRQRATFLAGMAKKQMGEKDAALNLLRQATEIKSDPVIFCQSQAQIGELLVDMGRTDEAMVALEACLANPADPNAAARARLNLARILSREESRLATANRYAMSVFILSQEPELCREAMLLSIRLSLRMGKIEEAENTWKEFGKRYPDELSSEAAQKTAERLQQAK